MPREVNKLSARTVQTVTKKGRHADGGGLYLVVDKGGAKRWAFIYRDRRTQKLREKGLGGVGTVSLAKARDKAIKARAALAAGNDPINDGKSDYGENPTFGALADELVAALEPSWRNQKHADQWKMTLRVYCKPLRDLPVDKITTEDVLGVLQPIWLKTPETASRLRGRIERVIDGARARGLRKSENPARWRGHLKLLLPAQRAKRGHHRAMPWSEVADFMARLRRLDSISALALEWTILTVARTSDSIAAPRSEIDRSARLWVIPAHRMKMERPHRVPLCDRCLEIFDQLAATGSRWLFPARDLDEHLSNMAMAECLRGLGDDATVHGFRSSFRDWAGDCTSFPRELAELALAHLAGNEVELAYRRGDALERRREMMEAWATFCGPKRTNVVHLRQTGRM